MSARAVGEDRESVIAGHAARAASRRGDLKGRDSPSSPRTPAARDRPVHRRGRGPASPDRGCQNCATSPRSVILTPWSQRILCSVPRPRRTEQSIFQLAQKRSIERLLKHQSYVPLPAEERTSNGDEFALNSDWLSNSRNVGLASENCRLISCQISFQDLLLHFDDLDLKKVTSPWNVFESLLEEVRIQPPKVIARTTAILLDPHFIYPPI